MADKKQLQSKIRSSIFLIALLILFVLLVVSLPDYLSRRQQVTSTSQTSSTETLPPSTEPITEWEDYKNTTYNASFTYPAGWEMSDKTEDIKRYNGFIADDLILDLEFFDPVMKKQFECANTTFYPENIGNTDCISILQSLSQTQINDLEQRRYIDSIYFQVAKNPKKLSTKDWLESHYRIAETELKDYQVGPEVTLGGIKGFFSRTGCCGATDNSYVVSHDDVIISLGSTDPAIIDSDSGDFIEDGYFSQIAKTFQFTD